MSQVKDGGPAFPMQSPFIPRADGTLFNAHEYGPEPTSGMSLRDWFAGQSLCGLLAAPETKDVTFQRAAIIQAWRIADGMIERRPLSDKPSP